MSRAHKYHAIPTTVDNIRFDSKKEAQHYQGLKLLQLAGAIRELELQPVFKLYAICHGCNGGGLCEVCHSEGRLFVAKYVADFRYINQATGEQVTEDAKGFKTPVYRIKKRWTEAQYGITITEV